MAGGANTCRRFSILWLAAWTLGFVGVVGCGSRSSPDVAATPGSNPGIDPSDHDRRLVLPDHDDNKPTDDPVADGWRSEAMTELANERLDILGKYLTDDQPDPTIADQIASSRFSAATLVPREPTVVYRDDVFEIRAADSAPGSSDRSNSGPTAEAFARTFAPIRAAFADHRERHCKFKLFHIELSDDQLVTRQYFHLSGRTDKSAKEQNSTWTMTWSLTPESGPRLDSIRVDRFEEVRVKTDRGALFSDATRSVLGSTPAYAHCLSVGIGELRHRLEARLSVYNFGHHGIAISDVNGDGLDDVYACQTGGVPNHLFVRRADGTVEDRAAPSRIDYLDNTRSALLVDLDNDDDQDLVLALNTGVVLLENDGQGIFSPRARLPRIRQAYSISAADYDRDGLLDLYFCVYYATGDEKVSDLPVPVPYFDATNGGPNYLVRNLSDWKFADVTKESGLDHDNRRFSFASVWEDVDNDGDQDLLVVNDFGPKQLFRNDQGRFHDIADRIGMRDRAFGMGATFGDFNRDGWSDVYLANMFSAAGNRVTHQPHFKPEVSAQTRAQFQYLARGNSLFQNSAQGFIDVTILSGVAVGRWSWGTLFTDINNDGWDDLLVANGFITGESPQDL
jgi:hypothetical protein